MTINGGTFTSNISNNGGAVYSNNIEINGGTFTTNNALLGGAVYSVNAITITTGTFTSNGTTSSVTTTNGGAIYSPAAVTIDGGTFTSNTATSGGAISSTAAITMTSGTFTSNSATDGGALHTTSSVNISGGSFDKNASTGTTAYDSDNDTLGNGGGAVYGGSITVSGNSVFTSNTADSESGSGGALLSTSSVTIEAGTFGRDDLTGNTAADGGAVFARTVTIKGGSFIYNKAGTSYSGSGGAVYAIGNVTISGGTFDNNSVDGSTEDHLGGAIYSGNNVTLNGTILFSDNTSDNGHGGAIYAVNKISNTTGQPMFSGNEAHTGGAIYSAYTGTGTNYAIELVNASFDQNVSDTDGGAAYTAGIAKFSNSTFTSNTAENFGGGVFANGHVLISYCTFGGTGTAQGLGNSAGASGGAIYTQGSGNSRIEYSAFVQNSAVRGGAVALSSPPTAGTDSSELHKIIVQRCYFGSNSASVEGGAMRLDGYSSQVLQCTFEANQNTLGSDGLKGGALYQSSARITTANCTFYNNTASAGYGGGICIASDGSQTYAAVMMNSFVSNRTGSGQGGGIYLDRSTGMILFGNLLVNNFAGSNSGKDVFVNTGTISSGGYNILTDFGLMSSGRPSSFSWYISPSVTGDAELDSYDTGYLMTDFYNDPIVYAYADYSIGANSGYQLWVLSLRESTDTAPNIALGFASGVTSRQYFNTYGLEYLDNIDNTRPSANRWDTGAHQLSTKIGEGGEEEDDDSGFLSRIKISGLPVTMCYVGQTTSLVVKGYDQANRLLGNIAVTWTVEPSGYVELDNDTGNLYIYRTTPAGQYVKITATSSNGLQDSTRLYVREDDTTGTNLNDTIWKRVYEKSSSSLSDSSLTVDRELLLASVESSTFQNAFVSAWGVGAQIATVAEDSDFDITSDSTTVTNSESFKNSKSGVAVVFNDNDVGDLLPFQYSWYFTGTQMKDLTGDFFTLSSDDELKASAASDVLDLQNVFRASFQSTEGSQIPVIGTNGVSFSDAVSAGAFSVSEYSGESTTGVTITLKAYVANTEALSNTQLIETSDGSKVLVVPDGTSDTSIAGSMFLLEKADTAALNDTTNNNSSSTSTNSSSSTKSSGGGGGGGCNISLSGIFAIACLSLLLRRK